MKTRDLVNLLNRAAAGLETPQDLHPFDLAALIEDLTGAASELDLSRKQSLDFTVYAKDEFGGDFGEAIETDSPNIAAALHDALSRDGATLAEVYSGHIA